MSAPFEKTLSPCGKSTMFSGLISQSETSRTKQTKDDLVLLLRLISQHSSTVEVKVGKERDTKGHPY